MCDVSAPGYACPNLIVIVLLLSPLEIRMKALQEFVWGMIFLAHELHE